VRAKCGECEYWAACIELMWAYRDCRVKLPRPLDRALRKWVEQCGDEAGRQCEKDARRLNRLERVKRVKAR
jgi:hypothetical protein